MADIYFDDEKIRNPQFKVGDIVTVTRDGYEGWHNIEYVVKDKEGPFVYIESLEEGSSIRGKRRPIGTRAGFLPSSLKLIRAYEESSCEHYKQNKNYGLF